MTAEELLPRIEGVKKSRSGWMAKCPAHKNGQEHTPSLSIKNGTQGVVLKCFAGCESNDICASIGIKVADLFFERRETHAEKNVYDSTPKFQTVATYDYQDEHGELRYQVVRQHARDPIKPCGYRKKFQQRRPDGKGDWIWDMEGVERVLYRLPQLKRDIVRGLPVFVVEGEKDAESMVKHGFTATCNVGGAKKWEDSYSEMLRDAEVIIIADKDESGREHAKIVAEKLQGVAKRTRIIELPDVNGHKVKVAADFFSAGGDAGQLIEIVDNCKTLLERIQGRRFNIHVKPRPAEPRYFVQDTPICTPGNLTAISALPKGGKSAWIGAMMAAGMGNGTVGDRLGVTSHNPDGKALIHFDTEQSEYDYFHVNERALRRAGLGEPPGWFHSYCVTGFPIKDARAAVPLIMSEVSKVHGGIHSVLIDGCADLAFDVNDQKEAAEIVTEWHALAIKYHCPIIGGIHLNPKSDKTRGHLGSQLERKAETNLRREKDGEAVVVWADKNRRAPILKNFGPRFIWSEDAQMHVSTVSAAQAKDETDRTELRPEAEAVFEHAGKRALQWSEFVTSLGEISRLKRSGARKRMEKMIRLGLIKKDVAGLYVLTT